MNDLLDLESSIESTIHFTESTRALCDRAPRISAILNALAAHADTPHLVLAKRSDLGSALPEALDPMGPLWVVALSDSHAAKVPTLARSVPNPVNALSTDMLHCVVFFEWRAGEDLYVAPYPLLMESISHELGDRQAVLFLTSTVSVLASYVCDDVFHAGLQGAYASAGPNYKPWRIWSEEQLEAAARRYPSTPDHPVFLEWSAGAHHWLSVVDLYRDEKAWSAVQGLPLALEPIPGSESGQSDPGGTAVVLDFEGMLAQYGLLSRLRHVVLKWEREKPDAPSVGTAWNDSVRYLPWLESILARQGLRGSAHEHVLVLAAPSSFEPILDSLAMAQPTVEWAVHPRAPQGESCLVWRLPTGHSIAVSWASWTPAFTKHDATSAVTWVPVVFCAGDTVAVGGFIAEQVIQGDHPMGKGQADEGACQNASGIEGQSALLVAWWLGWSGHA